MNLFLLRPITCISSLLPKTRLTNLWKNTIAGERSKVVELLVVFTLPFVVEITISAHTASDTSAHLRSASINKVHAYLLKLSFLSTKVNTSVYLVAVRLLIIWR